MFNMMKLFIIVLYTCLLFTGRVASNNNEEDAIRFLQQYDQRAQEEFYRWSEAAWVYESDLTEENKQLSIEADLVVSEFLKEVRRNASAFDRTGFSSDTVRQLKKLLYIGDAALEDPKDLEDLTTIISSMQERYSTGKVCLENKCLDLEPGLVRVMANSRNYDELHWAWHGWRKAVSGSKAKDDFKEYVRLKNMAAAENDQPDSGAYWRSWYEVDNFDSEVLKLYNELKPFYQQLHAYVRRKLYNIYGSEYINLQGPIPAHLFGNMWAQSWVNLLDICQPYSDKPNIDITPVLQEKGYDALRMFQVSEEFFVSLGLIPMPQEFWDKSIIERPEDRDLVCHASAWDFFNQKDFRIKQCTDITQDSFVTIHHEMGHIQYYLQYKDQPAVYRDGANPGFHEAVGDVLALSVSTPKHLQDVGLLDDVVDDPEGDINYLMQIALDKLAFFPFAILMDQWRWGVFDGSTPESRYNEEWWKLRLFYQGIIPPTVRSEMDFDPAAKYHISADVPYIRYFISHVLQFQFHEALCNASGHTGPLLKCDIYRSETAGKLLGDMLALGSSVPWPEAMERITGQREISALPLVKYFQPLLDFLEKENRANDDTIGWSDTEWMPSAPSEWTGSAVSSNNASLVTIFITCIFYLIYT
ncbi:angiotensin-converting enzyme-like [Amphiura filiformis]|uniref:angiotensin-converting enzyme-like n=1 Tax=Amphiura filiformis TaxID=82378 RepID=UPI003B21FCE0